MKKDSTTQAIFYTQPVLLTRIEVCTQLNIPETLLSEMEEYGLFQLSRQPGRTEPLISESAVYRIQAACRLHHDLGVNLAGVVLALELRDELLELRQHVAILERLKSAHGEHDE